MQALRLVAMPVLMLVVGGLPCAALTLEEVVTRHVAAKGGPAWNEIRSMKITGSYTAFSETHEFTIHRKRENKYRLEAGFLDSKLLTGFDGQSAWQDSGEGPGKVEGLDLVILEREADFTTPFFDYKERGYRAELLGEVDFEGLPAIGIKLVRDDEAEETWYLDPETYLEMGRVSPGSDWMGPVARTTYYDDFRTVSGVKIPFYVQSQWYTRDRVFEAASVEANVEIDDALFGMPLPPGMGPLVTLVGSWKIALQQRDQPGADWQKSERQSEIAAQLRGGMLQEHFQTPEGVEVVRNITYDKFGEQYRITQIDSHRTQMNVLEGTLGEDGRLVVSNVDTGTSWSSWGMTFHNRVTIYDISEDAFKADYESSIDGGQSWFVNGQATYTRSAEQ